MEETIEYRGFTIEIKHDDSAENPRIAWDNLGTFAYKHSRYHLGDEEINDPIDWLLEKLDREDEEVEYNNETFSGLLSDFRSKYAALAVHAYEHGGITLNTTGFSCTWDSGMVGIIFCSLEDVCVHWSMAPDDSKWETLIDDWVEKGKKVSLRDATIRILEGEIETQDQYLTGQVFGYNIDYPDGENDSCWGFYGDSDYCVSEAKAAVDCHVNWLLKEHIKQLKAWIKNRVPVHYRHALSY